ncbi:unnamed protein product [Didymodactylos carnosus]|uniref:Amino acid transporter n=1 Tax=Didymodactylos carnosus TaxID=1234261 RepID=A0A8S2KRB2_9BILA|nr:unnamed protein product [Didymodactylos carnosus]CAF3862732.1 unnamed protein product [Didymodactylos carnosus]
MADNISNNNLSQTIKGQFLSSQFVEQLAKSIVSSDIFINSIINVVKEVTEKQKEQIGQLTQRLNAMESQLNTVVMRVNDHDQYTKRKDLIIYGIPFQSDENVTVLVIDLMSKVGLQLTKNDFYGNHRLLPSKNSQNKSRQYYVPNKKICIEPRDKVCRMPKFRLPKCQCSCSKDNLKEQLLLILTIVSVVLAIGIGIALREIKCETDERINGCRITPEDITYIDFPGQLFINVLKMLILPLIVSSIISALAQLDAQTAGKIGVRAIVYYFATTIIAAIIGIILVLTIRPGSRGAAPTIDSKAKAAEGRIADTILDLFRIFINSIINVVKEATEKQQGQIGQLTQHLNAVESQLNTVVMRVNDHDQYKKRKDLLIYDIPFQSDENVTVLVIDLMSKVALQLIRMISMEFLDCFLQKILKINHVRKKFREIDELKSIFINEHLSQHNNQIYLDAKIKLDKRRIFTRKGLLPIFLILIESFLQTNGGKVMFC